MARKKRKEVRQVKLHRTKPLFIAAWIVLAAALVYSLFFRREAIVDIFVCAAFALTIYWFSKKHNLTIASVALLLMGVMLHMAGSLGMYARFALPLIGYDKVTHIGSSFALAYALFEVLPMHKRAARCAIAIIVVLGLGATVEITEFIGTKYFGVNNGGIFTMLDGLPQIRSDLQRYDIYFDMMANLLGACIGIGAALTRHSLARKKRTGSRSSFS